ncbi:MAG: hypothetical protein ACOCV1_03575 [Bacillota bacterium]
MKNLNKSFKNIIHPSVDFATKDDLKKEPKYINLIYEKIYSEIFLFLERKKEIKIDTCKFKNNIGRILFLDQRGKENRIKIVFKDLTVIVYLNNEFIEDSQIHGAFLDKDLFKVSDIKVDLISIKKSIKSALNLD